nr:sperm acrosome-associated protein 7 [Aotus nancymaae]
MSQVLTFHSVLETKGGSCRPSEHPSPSARGSMAVSQGAGTLCFVLLLCCWQETELRPRTMTPGLKLSQSSWICQEVIFFTHMCDVGPCEPGLPEAEEVNPRLAGIIPFTLGSLESAFRHALALGSHCRNAGRRNAGHRNAGHTHMRNAGIDENFQADGSENYHELLENLQLSSGTEDKISNDEASANANLHGAHSENYHGPLVSPGSEKRVSSKEKKNSKNTQYKPLSVLDKILQNMGRSSGNSFHKEQPRTSAQSRRPGGQ